MGPVQKLISLWLAIVASLLLAACGGSSTPAPPLPAPLSSSEVNLIFVVSEDMAYQEPGDMNLNTGNLTNRGLQRALMMGTFLQQQVLGGKNVNSIYALEPMTHLQTANAYPDMVGLETIQQFAMLNQTTQQPPGDPPVTPNSYPLFASYTAGSVPDGVVPQLPLCAPCQGIDFNDRQGDNEALVTSVIEANVPGFYVFSAPWETIGTLLANINRIHGYGLDVHVSYAGPNYVYAFAIGSVGTARLVTYNANLNPAPSYPTLPAGKIVSAACTQTFVFQVTGGVGTAVIPAGTNTNETVYMIRHAEAHPTPYFEDGNYVGAGQWRALDLPNALAGKIAPDEIYSIDPAIGYANAVGSASYVRPALTVEPYAIANNLPLELVTSFAVFDQNAPDLATNASNFFFTGGTFSNKTLLVAWEHDHIPPTINALLATYHGGQTAPNWLDSDYDSIWRVKLDSQGNLTVDNSLCEGISSASLPAMPPQF
jgi:hypothetical protein